LKAEGIDVPAGMAVTVLENTDKQFHLVLPPVPTDELPEGDLEAVAGGQSPRFNPFFGQLASSGPVFYASSNPFTFTSKPIPNHDR
jgi:hypothetical protein